MKFELDSWPYSGCCINYCCWVPVALIPVGSFATDTKKPKNEEWEKTLSLGSLKRHLHFFPYCCSDGAEHFADSLIKWITEGVDADGINPPDALDLNQVAPDAGHHCPDVEEGQNGKVNAPDESHGNAEDGRQQAIKPVFCHSEGGEAGLPDPIKAVGALWFGDHIFEVNLQTKRR